MDKPQFTDTELELKINDLKKLIENWVKDNDLWGDCGFKTYYEHFEDEPKEYPIVLVFYFEGPLYRILNAYEDHHLFDEFFNLFEDTDFYYEHDDHTTIVFHPIKDSLIKAYQEYFEWEWICELIKPNYTSLYEEIFITFSKNPKRLYDLHHRKFEYLIHEIFKNQGYQTEIGPGQNDGGIDLKIYQKDEIDQIATLVQVKKYKESLPIKLESVQALSAIVDDQKANRGLFITTSRYLPSVHKFAKRQNYKLSLKTSDHVQDWCKNIATKIVRDKSKIISDNHILGLLKQKKTANLEGQIFVAQNSYRFIHNYFALILKDSEHACLIMLLPSVDKDGIRKQMGFEIPILNNNILKNKTKDNIFRVSKQTDDDGRISLWGNDKLFFIWDGEPKMYDSD